MTFDREHTTCCNPQ